MPELFPVLRSLIDQHRRPGRFILLGSASPVLLRDSSESLAGRIAYTRLTPLNMLEVQQEADWKQQLLRGGFPLSLLAASDRASMRWRSNFITTYLERELPLLGLDSDVRVLRKLLLMIAKSQGQLLNTQGLSNSLGITRPTAARYIDFMEKSYLLTRLEPYYANTKKRLVKSPKLYLTDTGLFHALIGVSSFQHLLAHPMLGSSWEAFVIQQTESLLPEGLDIWFFRTHEGAEADLVLCRNDVPVACAEIKWSNAPKVSRGFRNITGYLNTSRNFIITPEADTYPVAENIRVTSLKDWLELVLNEDL
jgi:predicted AAA+ superfamily ATPase